MSIVTITSNFKVSTDYIDAVIINSGNNDPDLIFMNTVESANLDNVTFSATWQIYGNLRINHARIASVKQTTEGYVISTMNNHSFTVPAITGTIADVISSSYLGTSTPVTGLETWDATAIAVEYSFGSEIASVIGADPMPIINGGEFRASGGGTNVNGYAASTSLEAPPAELVAFTDTRSVEFYIDNIAEMTTDPSGLSYMGIATTDTLISAMAVYDGPTTTWMFSANNAPVGTPVVQASVSYFGISIDGTTGNVGFYLDGVLTETSVGTFNPVAATPLALSLAWNGSQASELATLFAVVNTDSTTFTHTYPGIGLADGLAAGVTPTLGAGKMFEITGSGTYNAIPLTTGQIVVINNALDPKVIG